MYPEANALKRSWSNSIPHFVSCRVHCYDVSALAMTHARVLDTAAARDDHMLLTKSGRDGGFPLPSG